MSRPQWRGFPPQMCVETTTIYISVIRQQSIKWIPLTTTNVALPGITTTNYVERTLNWKKIKNEKGARKTEI